jgi:4-hydroxy-3-polyprenylbenzoate decarboxylase
VLSSWPAACSDQRRRAVYHQRVRRIVVGITGSTGSIYGIRLLERLREAKDVETHLILSAPGKRTLLAETRFTVKDVEELASVVYDNRDIGAALASGSFKTAGMAIAPCSVKTLAALATGYSDTLIARAGDVHLKEGRTLIALVRETPLHAGHLRQMLALAELGGVVLPPMPAFYHRPQTIDDIVNHTVARVLDRLAVEHDLVPEWTGTGAGD